VTVSKAFEKTKAQNHKIMSPNLLHTDKGLEFENKHFIKLLNNFNIKMYHTQNLEKSAVIEQFTPL
jgi:hypothetical protein